ncbi:FHA domain-containing protein [Agromyces mediolanus]|uniref:FHA domain-containing protein n=1 Tax=Agromyces mediolanus TaxID=41986 RepID=UPI003833A5D7
MIRYTPDSAAKTIALARGDAALLLPAAAWRAHPALWEALSAADPVEAVLGELARDGITALPDFALVVAVPGTLRVVVRGGFRVRAGAEAVTAAGVSTWHERAIETDAVFEVLAPFARTGGDDTALPLVEGAAPASALARGELDPVEGAVAADASAEPTPSEPPALATTEAAAHERADAAPAAPEPVTPEPVTPEPVTPEPVEADASAATSTDPAPAAPEHTLVPADDETIVIGTGAGNGLAHGSGSAAADAGAADPALGAAVTGDHDGLTVAVTKLQRLRRERASGPLADESRPAPEAGAGQADAPALRLVLADGREEPLTGEVVLGRSPSAGRSSGASLPKLVQIGVGDPDISRSHLRLAVEGGTVVVTDLQSRNGTTVIQPDRSPVKLRAGEPTPVLAGTLIDLGGGCTIRVVAD